MRRRRPTPRRGLTLVPSLVCLVVATSICLALLRNAHSERMLIQNLERSAQADWLAESGLARAGARLAANPAYPGETWKIPAEAFAGRHPGEVRITVSSEKDSAKRKVRVEADYPVGDESRARQSRTQIIDLGPDPSKGPK